MAHYCVDCRDKISSLMDVIWISKCTCLKPSGHCLVIRFIRRFLSRVVNAALGFCLVAIATDQRHHSCPRRQIQMNKGQCAFYSCTVTSLLLVSFRSLSSRSLYYRLFDNAAAISSDTLRDRLQRSLWGAFLNRKCQDTMQFRYIPAALEYWGTISRPALARDIECQ